jgi:hypothetical protein
MTDQRDTVVAGVDAHTDEHHVAVADAQGRPHSPLPRSRRQRMGIPG